MERGEDRIGNEETSHKEDYIAGISSCQVASTPAIALIVTSRVPVTGTASLICIRAGVYGKTGSAVGYQIWSLAWPFAICRLLSSAPLPDLRPD